MENELTQHMVHFISRVFLSLSLVNVHFCSSFFLSFCSFRSFVPYRQIQLSSPFLFFNVNCFFSLSSFFSCVNVFFLKGVDCYRRRLHIFFFFVSLDFRSLSLFFLWMLYRLSFLSLDVVSSLFSFFGCCIVSLFFLWMLYRLSFLSLDVVSSLFSFFGCCIVSLFFLLM